MMLPSFESQDSEALKMNYRGWLKPGGKKSKSWIGYRMLSDDSQNSLEWKALY